MLLIGDCWTMARPPRAGAVLIREGRIAAVGDAGELRARWPAEKRLLVHCITPGVHDAHVHPTLWGRALAALDLAGLTDPRAVADRVAARSRALPAGEWVRGGGFLFDLYPNGTLLTVAAPANPVLLASRDLHSAWANDAALRLAGIDRATPDPQGGRILRDAEGEPTGYLLERAVQLVESVVPPPTSADLVAGLADLSARGYVAAHAMPFGRGEDLAWAERLAGAGDLPLRLWWAVTAEQWREVEPGPRGDDLEVAAVKLFADGALGSRTAWMHTPYADGGCGMALDRMEQLQSTGRTAIAAGYTLAVHAIGTRAVAVALDVFAGLAPRGHRRLRLEHAQHMRDEEIDRLRSLPVAVSMQPAHLMADAGLVRRYFPGHSREAFRFRDVAATGVPLAFGSDAPVVPPDLAAGLSAATAHALTPAQSLPLERVIGAFTHDAALTAGWRDSGTLVPGARADLALWEKGRLVGRVWRGRLEWLA
jgi:predicted amidohydrolase YtcJ